MTCTGTDSKIYLIPHLRTLTLRGPSLTDYGSMRDMLYSRCSPILNKEKTLRILEPIQRVVLTGVGRAAMSEEMGEKMEELEVGLREKGVAFHLFCTNEEE